MYRISKTWRFAAAHHLPTLPTEHKCHRVHGHNYAVSLIIESDTLDGHGFVTDYGQMDAVFGTGWLKPMFDHQDMNEVMVDNSDHPYVANRSNAPDKMLCVTCGAKHEPVNPTAENLARLCHDVAMSMFGHLGRLTVRVAETDGTWAEYSEPNDE